MVLFPIADERLTASATSAWQAVQEREELEAKSHWIVTQPSHAVLAGELAAALREDLFGPIDASVSRSIALHDAGWSMEDAEQIQRLRSDPKARPSSFLEASPEQFLRAWTGSINTAEKFATVGGYIVSRHFERLSERNDEKHRAKLEKFRRQEKQRQERLRPNTKLKEQELEKLVDALQFCDLLSLYLCCGSKRSVRFSKPDLSLTRNGEEYRLHPFPFREHRQFSFSALRHPAPKDKREKTGATFYINL
ncbi:MAG TPA: DUF3891 family protein [Terriglobales bacterium]|nr:DUF3891 family protein [Terriglobales bacterium]